LGLGIKVHRRLGPGFPESVHADCLCWELSNSGMSHTREVPLAVTYKGMRLNPGYHPDIIIEGEVISKIKAIERILPRHRGANTHVRRRVYLLNNGHVVFEGTRDELLADLEITSRYLGIGPETGTSLEL
jgi:GxxExxY protein